MNLREFNELVVGDKIENAMTQSEGTVSSVRDSSLLHGRGRVVSVKWGAALAVAVEFSYTVHSTAWMHWDRIEPEPAGAS